MPTKKYSIFGPYQRPYRLDNGDSCIKDTINVIEETTNEDNEVCSTSSSEYVLDIKNNKFDVPNILSKLGINSVLFKDMIFKGASFINTSDNWRVEYPN